jgi:hypothetical protein
MEKQAKIERLYYLDWLRDFAVMLLIPFHTGMIFVIWDFHIKNSVTSTGLTIVNAFIDNWRGSGQKRAVFDNLNSAEVFFTLFGHLRPTPQFVVLPRKKIFLTS